MQQEAYIKSDEKMPEFTWKAILLGSVLAIVLGAANTYLGLYAGMTVSASIPAAVISMGILRGIFRSGTILENNMVQTIASTGESLAAGVIFTLPALVIAGVWTGFDFWKVTLVAFFGGVLGIIFMIPMRRSLIIEEKTLKYPEGTACAEVLKAGEGEKIGMWDISLGILIGGLVKLFINGIALLKGTVEISRRIGGSIFYFGSDISAALVGVGAIVGFNIGMLMFLGGAIGWLIGIPLIAINYGASEKSALDVAWEIWSTQIRYIGVGAMIIAGVWSIVKIRHGIINGFLEVFKIHNFDQTGGPIRTEKNISQKKILVIIIMVIIGMASFFLTFATLGFTLVSVFLVIFLSFFLVAVASYICGLVGSSNSPVSGMTIVALLVTALVFYIMGFRGSFAIIATLIVSGIICCATCTSGDISQDLKTGYLVGATPAKQQWGELLGVLVSVFFFAPILTLLHHAYGIGTSAPGSLKAPQAALFASLVKAIFGDEKMPWKMIIYGMLLAIILIIIDEFLEKRNASFRLYTMPVAVGIYLPFSLSIPILAGGVIEYFINRKSKKQDEVQSKGMRKIVLLSSGLIAGEALMGIIVAIVIAVIGYYKFQTKLPYPFPISANLISIFSIVTLMGLVAMLFIKGLNASREKE